MARSRNIKPGFFQNEDLAECHPLARILFSGLWCEADRAGRLEDRPKRIKASVLPYDDCDPDELLEQLRVRGFILRYEIGGKRYIQIVEFSKHQAPHIKEAASTIPAPDKPGAGPVQSPGDNEAGPSDSGFLIPDSSNSTQGDSPQREEDSLPHEREEVRTPVPPTAAGAACKAMRKGGVPQSNPSHPDLLAAIAEGATADEFEDAAREAVSRGKPNMVYVVAMVRGRRRDAAAQQHGTANASQAPPTQPQSKTVAGLMALEAMKRGNRNSGLVPRLDHHGDSAAAMPVAGRSAGGSDGDGDGSGVDRRGVARPGVDER
jgi:hypothetical protein